MPATCIAVEGTCPLPLSYLSLHLHPQQNETSAAALWLTFVAHLIGPAQGRWPIEEHQYPKTATEKR